MLWELSSEEVVGEDLEAVLTFPFLWVLSFLRTMLLAPEANFVLLFPGCSPCYEDGGVALEADTVFPFTVGSLTGMRTMMWPLR